MTPPVAPDGRETSFSSLSFLKISIRYNLEEGEIEDVFRAVDSGELNPYETESFDPETFMPFVFDHVLEFLKRIYEIVSNRSAEDGTIGLRMISDDEFIRLREISELTFPC